MTKILKRQLTIKGVTIPANTIYYIEDNVYYFCAAFPRNYQGIYHNARLKFVWYDATSDTIGDTVLSRCKVSRECYKAFLKHNKKVVPRKIHHEPNYERMMSHARKKKNGSGGVRLINDAQINPPMKWREVTEEAHWAFSGNASIVASNCR